MKTPFIDGIIKSAEDGSYGAQGGMYMPQYNDLQMPPPLMNGLPGVGGMAGGADLYNPMPGEQQMYGEQEEMQQMGDEEYA